MSTTHALPPAPSHGSFVTISKSSRDGGCCCMQSSMPDPRHSKRELSVTTSSEATVKQLIPSCATSPHEPQIHPLYAFGNHHDVELPLEYMNSLLEQSPIDICEMESQHVTMNTGDIEFVLGDAEAEIVHLGNNFQINWSSGGGNYVKIEGKIFNAVQFHFHTPSEHTINGKHKPMEFHMVHQAEDGNLAVIALFLREGKENAFLSQFWHELPGMDYTVRNKVSVGKINAKHLDLVSGRFFRYRGSLTTPPYTEGVEWIVVQDVAEASIEQIEIFRKVLPSPSNARAVQPLNRRRVHLLV